MQTNLCHSLADLLLQSLDQPGGDASHSWLVWNRSRALPVGTQTEPRVSTSSSHEGAPARRTRRR